MKEYKRLTERTKHGIAVLDSEERFVLSCGGYATTKALNRLAELEDKIENGTLVEFNKPFYSNQFNAWCMYLKEGDYIKSVCLTKEQADSKLKELQEKDNERL